MTHRINTISIKDEIDLDRSIEEVEFVQSIKINGANGNFYVAYPLLNDGSIVRYPQNPNNSLYDPTTIKNIEFYGDLDFPLDVGVDKFGQKLWIADAGNSKVTALNLNDLTFFSETEGFTLPHSIIVNPNNRNVFIKSFSDDSTQKVTEMDDKGDILMEFEFPANANTTLTRTKQYLATLPKYNTMDYDSNLNRLWFVSESVVYMMDLDTNQIITQDLQDVHLYNVSCVSVDRTSGNAFVIIDEETNWYVQQLYKDNNSVLGTAYILEQPVPYTV